MKYSLLNVINVAAGLSSLSTPLRSSSWGLRVCVCVCVRAGARPHTHTHTHPLGSLGCSDVSQLHITKHKALDPVCVCVCLILKWWSDRRKGKNIKVQEVHNSLFPHSRGYYSPRCLEQRWMTQYSTACWNMYWKLPECCLTLKLKLVQSMTAFRSCTSCSIYRL